jgi:hypothetical protein
MMKTYTKISALVLLATLGLAGCKNKDTMDMLKSNQRYPQLNSAYWANIKKTETALWKQAVIYCDQNPAKINCGSLQSFAIINNGATTAPAIGHSGESIELPHF